MLTRIRPMMRLSLLAGMLTSAAAFIVSPAMALDVTVKGLRNTAGDVVVCLWRQKDAGFPNCAKGRPWKTLKAPASKPTVTFADVPPGTYAVSMFHDEKRLGRPETTFFGMPKSGIGLANDPTIGGKNRPTFGRASVDVPATTKIAITAKYLF